VLNVTSFYDGLLAFMQSTVNSGFLDQNQLDGIHVSNNAAELLGRLHDASVKARGLDDYRDI
jgi:predicted Rossmann-fold nucleotide-binding protein